MFPSTGAYSEALGKILEYREREVLIAYHPSKIGALINPDKIREHFARINEFLKRKR